MLLFVLLSIAFGVSIAEQQWVGDFKSFAHGIAGTVYIVDDQTLRIQSFTYDGNGPDAFFYVGTSGGGGPSGAGKIVGYSEGEDSGNILKRFSGSELTLKLPDGVTSRDVAWIAVRAPAFAINFGELEFPERSLETTTQKPNGSTTISNFGLSAILVPLVVIKVLL